MQPNQQHNAQVDPFAPVPATFGGGLPGARHLEGRVVIIQPIRVDETTLGFDKKTPAPTLFADIIVVDGGPLTYGDTTNNAGQQLTPPTHRVETPARFTGWMDSHQYIVGPCRDLLRAGTPITVGIIERGTQGNRPYFLTETHTDVNRQPRTDPSFARRRQMAIDVFNAYQIGQWTPPTPIELNPQPVAAAPAQNWASQQAQPQTVASGSWQPQQAQAAPYAGAGVNAWAPAAQPVAAPVSAAPQTVGRDLSVPVPGFESLWPNMSEQQRASVWAAQPSGQAPPSPAQPVAQAAPAATPWG